MFQWSLLEKIKRCLEGTLWDDGDQICGLLSCGLDVGQVIANVREAEAGRLGALGAGLPSEVPQRAQGGQARALGPIPGGWDPPTCQQAEPVRKGPLEGIVLCE